MIWLAFRKMIHADSSYTDRVVSWWTKSTYGHVELLLEIRCMGPLTCTLCKQKPGDASRVMPPGMKHYINVSVGLNESVFYSIDRAFDSRPELWVFVQIPVYKHISTSGMLNFIRLQLAKEYNTIGCWCNMLMCCGCLGKRCGSRKLTPLDIEDGKATAWFCSELITATLQIGGYDDVFDSEPRFTTPQMLFDKATQITGTLITECPRKPLDSVFISSENSDTNNNNSAKKRNPYAMRPANIQTSITTTTTTSRH